MSARRADGGLTLLEVLVAFSLLGLVGAMAAGGISFGAAAWERTSETGARTAEGRVASKFMARLVGGARAVRMRDGTREPAVLFEGSATVLRLVAPLPARLAAPGAQYIALGLEDGDLVLRWSPLTRDRPALDPDIPPETLIPGLADLEFAYYDGTEWRDAWRGMARLPGLVRIVTVAADGTRRAVVTALPASGSVNGVEP